MNEKQVPKICVGVMVQQIRDLSDCECRVVLHLVAIGYPLYESIEILHKNLYGPWKGKTP